MIVELIHLAEATLLLQDDGGTFTVYRGGGRVPAYPHDTDEYRDRARELGYGDDAAAMSREHELTHHLLATWLGLPVSYTMLRLAAGLEDPMGWVEESAVMAVQRFARLRGVDLEDLAKRLGSR